MARWALLPEHVIRCNGHMVNGGRWKHEAQPGSVVCHLHGAAAPQVRKRAAERLIMSADHASQKLLEWLGPGRFKIRRRTGQIDERLRVSIPARRPHPCHGPVTVPTKVAVIA